MSDEKTDLISHFQSITGVDEARAKFYLESSNWEMQRSLDTFYAGDHPEPTEEPQPDLPSKSKPSRDEPKRSGFRSMRDILAQKDDSDSDDDRRGQEFFAGGSERSGQMISGPPRKKADPKSMAQAVFDAGKKQGAKTLEDEEREAEMRRQAAAKSNAFRGSGYRLGETEGDTVKIAGEPLASASKQGQIRQTLRFWQNGFTVDDGPLRDGSTEADRLFLHNVARGMIPQELIAAAQGDEVDLNVEDRRQENYAPPKKTLKAFGGEGHKLGSPVPDFVSSVPAPKAEAPVNPLSSVHVDESQPITTLQIRLGNGSRLVQKFNHSHCVRDIRAVVDSSSPAGSNYVLMTTFPNKELTDEQQTLAEAKLLNAVVVQRLNR